MNRTDAAEMYRNAILVLDIEKASKMARTMAEQHPLSLGESVELLLLMLLKQHPDARKAGQRWVKLLESYGGSKEELAIARATIRGMEGRRGWFRYEKVLRLLSSEVGLHPCSGPEEEVWSW